MDEPLKVGDSIYVHAITPVFSKASDAIWWRLENFHSDAHDEVTRRRQKLAIIDKQIEPAILAHKAIIQACHDTKVESLDALDRDDLLRIVLACRRNSKMALDQLGVPVKDKSERKQIPPYPIQVRIVCPECGIEQDAEERFYEGDPFQSLGEECVCGYAITESEWNVVSREEKEE